MRSKGMSQILALIIAATVFMLAAVTLIVMFQSGIMSSVDDGDRQACLAAVNSICAADPDATQSAPSSCDGVEGIDNLNQGTIRCDDSNDLGG